MIIGITGGSGSGKSLGSKFFKEKGFLIIDFDKIARDVCKKGSKCLNEIRLFFGEGVITPDGNLDRKKLAEIVFSDSDKRATLNKITHKYIKEEAFEIMEKSQNKNFVFDAPLLIEAGLGEDCDFIISVLSDKEKRTERIMHRDSISHESAKMRIESQQDDEFYIENSDFCVYNNGDEQEFIIKLSNILRSKLNDGDI